MSDDILEEIDEQDISQLRALYGGHVPRAVHIYNYLGSVIRWKRQRPGRKDITLMAPGGDWSNGTFVAVHEYSCYEVYLFTLEKDFEILHLALTKTQKIDWSRGLLMYAIHCDHYPTVLNALRETPFQNYQVGPSDIWWMSKEKANNLVLDCPLEVCISELKPHHSAIINSNWPHRYNGSEKYIETMIEVNGGYGVFMKRNGTLVAWALRNFLGLGVLQTAGGFKRRGYGSLVAKVLAKKLSEEEIDPVGTVMQENSVSQSMFEKIGFEKIGTVVYIDNIEQTKNVYN